MSFVTGNATDHVVVCGTTSLLHFTTLNIKLHTRLVTVSNLYCSRHHEAVAQLWLVDISVRRLFIFFFTYLLSVTLAVDSWLTLARPCFLHYTVCQNSVLTGFQYIHQNHTGQPYNPIYLYRPSMCLRSTNCHLLTVPPCAKSFACRAFCVHYLYLTIRILSLCISAHLTVLLLSNPVLNLALLFCRSRLVTHTPVPQIWPALYKYLMDIDIGADSFVMKTCWRSTVHSLAFGRCIHPAAY